MRMRRFFLILNRANAVLFFGIACLGGLLLLYAFYQLFQSRITPSTAYDSLLTDKTNAAIFSFGGFVRVGDTSNFRAGLLKEQSYVTSARSKFDQAVSNFLFYNVEIGQSHWVFPKNDWLCLSAEEFPQQTRDQLPVRKVFYVVVKEDTNHDRKLTAADRQVLGISAPDGSGYTELLTDIDSGVDVQVAKKTGPLTAIVFYTRQKDCFAAEIDVDRAVVLTEKKVASLP